MRKTYFQVSWGIALLIFDIRIIGFDILPDLLGYLLIFIGLSQLESIDRRFAIGKWTAAVLALLSITLFIKQNVIPFNQLQTITYDQLLWSSIGTVCEMIIFFGIYAGIHAFAKKCNHNVLASSARARWITYFFLNSIYLISIPFNINLPVSDSSYWHIILFIFIAIAQLSFVLLLRRAGNEFTKNKD